MSDTHPTTSTAHALAIIRILTGAIAFYTLLVWTFDFQGFINGGLISAEYRNLLYRTPLESAMAWSHFDWIDPSLRMPVHIVGLLIVALFTLGFYTRFTAVLTALLMISYANRAMAALFGLDQMLAMLTLYLAISRCGDTFSIDSWLAKKSDDDKSSASVTNRIATRLIQVHLLVALMTMLALFWEVTYAALIWPRLTRPIVLLLAVPMHLGIGMCLGMLEFGLIMLVANIAFIPARMFDRKQRP